MAAPPMSTGRAASSGTASCVLWANLVREVVCKGSGINVASTQDDANALP